MTVVKVFCKDRHIEEVDCAGHSGYAEHGYDILCAALSSIVQTTVLGLMQVLGISLDLSQNDELGQLHFKLPKLDSDKRKLADVLLDTMYLGIDNLSQTYSDYIELEVEHS